VRRMRKRSIEKTVKDKQNGWGSVRKSMHTRLDMRRDFFFISTPDGEPSQERKIHTQHKENVPLLQASQDRTKKGVVHTWMPSLLRRFLCDANGDG
jgi:hypothetical protein